MNVPHHHTDRQTPQTRAEWDFAREQGTLTSDDVVQRLRRIAVHEFGEEGPAGYDDQGFFVSLTAEGVKIEGGVTLRIHTRDHWPPHVHIERPGKPDTRLDLITGAVMGDLPRDVKSRQLRGFQAAIRENFELLSRIWTKNHGPLGAGDHPDVGCGPGSD